MQDKWQKQTHTEKGQRTGVHTYTEFESIHIRRFTISIVYTSHDGMSVSYCIASMEMIGVKL